MKPYDIYIDRRLRDGFDICFAPHKTIDLIVSNLIFHDTISASTCIAVDAELKNLSEVFILGAEDGMAIFNDAITFSFCVPIYISGQIGLDSDVTLSTFLLERLSEHQISVGSSVVGLYRLIPLRAVGGISVANDPVDVMVSLSFGQAISNIGIDTNNIHISKTGKIAIQDGVCLYADIPISVIKKMSLSDFVGVDCSTTSIGYSSMLVCEGGFSVSADEIDLAMSNSLGRVYGTLGVDAKLSSPPFMKYFISEQESIGISVLSEIALYYILAAEQYSVGVDVEALMRIKTPAKLFDYQNDTLANIDFMTLKDLSYKELDM